MQQFMPAFDPEYSVALGCYRFRGERKVAYSEPSLQLIDFHSLGAKDLSQVNSRMYLELDFTPVFDHRPYVFVIQNLKHYDVRSITAQSPSRELTLRSYVPFAVRPGTAKPVEQNIQVANHGYKERVLKSHLVSNCPLNHGQDCTAYDGHIQDAGSIPRHRAEFCHSQAEDRGEHDRVE